MLKASAKNPANAAGAGEDCPIDDGPAEVGAVSTAERLSRLPLPSNRLVGGLLAGLDGVIPLSAGDTRYARSDVAVNVWCLHAGQTSLRCGMMMRETHLSPERCIQSFTRNSWPRRMMWSNSRA